MKTTKFAVFLGRYFTNFLPNDQGCSPQTVDSYRFAFILYLEYMESECRIKPEKIDIRHFTKDSVIGYLTWLEKTRKNSAITRNSRLAAMKSFVHFLKYEFPEHLEEYQRILSIPVKKTVQKEISYLKTDGAKLLVDQVDPKTTNGLRDYLIILLLYTTGIRVSELINICVKDISLTEPYTLKVLGKGKKYRYVPLMKTTIPYIRKYLGCMDYDKDSALCEYLFKNHMGQPFTRQGINYLLKKYGGMARGKDPSLIPEDLSPHKIRHTTAMELLDAGVDLMYIRDLLGHSSVKVTEIYARTDARLKREAIEAASKELVPQENAQWDNNTDLKVWLKSFNKK